MTDSNGNSPPGAESVISDDQLRDVLRLLGSPVHEGGDFSRAQSLGVLSARVELLLAFGTDPGDAADLFKGFITVLATEARLLLGEDRQNLDVTAMQKPAYQTTDKLITLLIGCQLTRVLTTVEKVAPTNRGDEPGVLPATRALLRALITLTSLYNRDPAWITQREVRQTAVESLTHLIEARRVLQSMVQQMTE